MLDRLDNSPNQDAIRPELRSPAEILSEGLAFVRRRFTIILLTCSLTLGVAVLYLVVTVPTFTATAQLIVDAKSASGDAASVSTAVESQIAILKSEGVARAVIVKRGLVTDPEFSGGMARRINSSLSHLLGWSKPEVNSGVTRYAIEAFERKLSVRRSGLTYIVDLAFDSSDPGRASQILSTVVETYVTAQMDAKYKWSLQNDNWVKDRVNELRGQASAAKQAVADYNTNKIANSGATAEPGAPSFQTTTITDGGLRELEAAADAAARTYDSFLRMLRYTDAMQQQSAPVLEARLLTEVSRPYTASSPKARMVLVIALFGGVFLGIALGMLRDLLNRGRAPAPWPGAIESGTRIVGGATADRSYSDGSFRAEKRLREARPE
ncbi:Wzz/FepE/Etk N-terminal domain-containing protein [Bradyrhizobium canariense]|uniref:Wzz/FepE/Etk N-terminal domain-containing protein n=1 Tax=Bradyrhizobium canariense TaxID=255045 RepID=UPI002012D505|nr:Wzz/FepE/Etk N-terminal domain-containing protein [Bradyrhizobium canariense]